MSGASLSQDLYEFAIELRKLAYTMPGGHEDPLIRLSERMVRYADQERPRASRRRRGWRISNGYWGVLSGRRGLFAPL